MGLLLEEREWHEYYDYLSEYDEYYVLCMLANNENLWIPRINPNMYQQALNEFTRTGSLEKYPTKYIYQWMGIIMKNTAIIRSITALAGHDVGFPTDAVVDAFFGGESDEKYERWDEYKRSLAHKGTFSPDFGWMGQEEDDYNEEDEVDDSEAASQYLEDNGYYDKMVLPDDSQAWSDYGVQPLEQIISEYNDNLSPEEVLVLINKALDVTHQRGDLCSAFIEGGSATLSRISNGGYINESKENGEKMKDIHQICSELKPYMDSLYHYMANHGYTTKKKPKVILDNTKQEGVFVYTGYFDPEAKGIRLFVNGRGYKDILRTLAHELIHRKQDEDGIIEKSGYTGDKITEDKNLIRLEAEAYLKGNMAFRSWTETEQKKGRLK